MNKKQSFQMAEDVKIAKTNWLLPKERDVNETLVSRNKKTEVPEGTSAKESVWFEQLELTRISHQIDDPSLVL